MSPRWARMSPLASWAPVMLQEIRASSVQVLCIRWRTMVPRFCRARPRRRRVEGWALGAPAHVRCVGEGCPGCEVVLWEAVRTPNVPTAVSGGSIDILEGSPLEAAFGRHRCANPFGGHRTSSASRARPRVDRLLLHGMATWLATDVWLDRNTGVPVHAGHRVRIPYPPKRPCRRIGGQCSPRGLLGSTWLCGGARDSPRGKAHR